MNIHEETAMRCWMLCHPPEQIERSEGETIEMIADLLERINNETDIELAERAERIKQLETLIEDYAKFCGHLPVDAGQAELQWRAYELLRPEEAKHAG
jgi:hypothetical protein